MLFALLVFLVFFFFACSFVLFCVFVVFDFFCVFSSFCLRAARRLRLRTLRKMLAWAASLALAALATAKFVYPSFLSVCLRLGLVGVANAVIFDVCIPGCPLKASTDM